LPGFSAAQYLLSLAGDGIQVSALSHFRELLSFLGISHVYRRAILKAKNKKETKI